MGRIKTATDLRKNYMESKPTFYELCNGYWLINVCIRKPENLLTVHETFKSAYNLLYETRKYQDIKWNRDSLAKTLKQTDIFVCPWFQDDTK